jgi:hypothetical protein
MLGDTCSPWLVAWARVQAMVGLTGYLACTWERTGVAAGSPLCEGPLNSLMSCIEMQTSAQGQGLKSISQLGNY